MCTREVRNRGSIGLGALANDNTYPYEDSLALEVDVGNGELVGERHCVQKLN